MPLGAPLRDGTKKPPELNRSCSAELRRAELLTAAAERDAGSDLAMFAQQLMTVGRVTLRDVERYGVTAEQLAAVQERCIQWGTNLLREVDGDSEFTED